MLGGIRLSVAGGEKTGGPGRGPGSHVTEPDIILRGVETRDKSFGGQSRVGMMSLLQIEKNNTLSLGSGE